MQASALGGGGQGVREAQQLGGHAGVGVGGSPHMAPRSLLQVRHEGLQAQQHLCTTARQTMSVHELLITTLSECMHAAVDGVCHCWVAVGRSGGQGDTCRVAFM